MFHCEIFDEVNDIDTRINWQAEGGMQISNKDYFLLNRVLYVPDNLFNDFAEEDRSYAKREIEAYLGFSFNAFKGIGNKSATGACVDSLSLPRQWNKISNRLKIKVPHYYWGPAQRLSIPKNANLVYSDIHNYLTWTVNQNLNNQKHIFCFEKPLGSPVFILSIGNKQLLTSDIRVCKEQEAVLKALAKSINKYFNHFISEILVFVNGSELVFGCINPEVIRSNKNENLDNFIYSHLVSEFFQWVN